jgi:hypothetical protein
MEALLITRVGEREWTRESLFDTECRRCAPRRLHEFCSATVARCLAPARSRFSRFGP